MQALNRSFEVSCSSTARKKPRVGLGGIVAESALIEVKHDLPLTVGLNEVLGKDLPEYKVPLTVLIPILRDDSFVLHAKPLFQNFVDLLPHEHEALFIIEPSLNSSNIE